MQGTNNPLKPFLSIVLVAGLVLGGALALWLGVQLEFFGLSHVWILQATVTVVGAGLFMCCVGSSVDALQKLCERCFETGCLTVLVPKPSAFLPSVTGGQFRPPRISN